MSAYSVFIESIGPNLVKIHIQGSPNKLDLIESVQYKVTGAKGKPVQVADRNTLFAVEFASTEMSEITARLFLKDGSTKELKNKIKTTPVGDTRLLGIRGTEQFLEPLDSGQQYLQLQHSFNVSESARSLGEPEKEIPLDKNSVIELIYDDGTKWLTGPDTLDDLFSQNTTGSATGKLNIPLTLRKNAATRGGVAEFVTLKVVNIFGREYVRGKIRELAKELEKSQLANLSGLYKLNSEFNLEKLDSAGTSTIAQPYLLFIHGTNSSTKGSFAELKGSQFWDYVADNFGSRVLAFEHETLSKSPLENVLDLIKALPNQANLHLISHSRGGIVGDLLCRFASTNGENGFSKEDIDLLEKNKRIEDIQTIQRIQDEFRKKSISIQKFIRVACPAHGTTLAAKRIDHILNIGFNLLGFGTGLSANPIYTAFKNLIAATINTKNEPDILPGLEAMNPDSPFIQILNQPNSSVSVDNPLFVLSGNCKAKVNLKGLIIIASKLFYLKKNDLVVDTESMYMGTQRDGVAMFMFDEGTDVDHFHYFKNQKTQTALLNILTATDFSRIPDFQAVNRRELFDDDTRNALLGLDGGELMRDQVSGQRPIAVILPGIMGSNIFIDNKKTWINYFGFFLGNLADLDIRNPGKAKSVVKTSYRKLADHLSSTYDVVTYPFDWRLSLDSLTDDLNAKIEELLTYNQPIKLIGHSMGGVLVRDFIVKHAQTWQKLNSSKGFQMVYMGSPLGGSYRIAAVLFGMDSVIRKLDGIDRRHSKEELIGIFRQFPGILSLLPYAKTTDFALRATWEKLRNIFGDNNWPIPEVSELKAFGNYRDLMMNASIDYTNISYVAGHDLATTSGHIEKTNSDGSRELVFLATSEGDASVTWETGIPKKLIDDNKVYYVNVTHGELANEPKIFDGITEIISRGTTNLLSRVRPSSRSEEKEFRMPEVMDFDLSRLGVTRTLLGLGGGMSADKPAVQPIRISVSHGDLRYATYPVLAGHFAGDGVLFAEKAIDWCLDGALSMRRKLGLYPGPIGTSEVILSEHRSFAGAIIVGLGTVGDLTAYKLFTTVEQGAVNYVLSLKTTKIHSKPLGVSSLFIGSEFAGLTIESSMEAIIAGVTSANQKLALLNDPQIRTVDHIEFIELYEDRVISAFFSLDRMERSERSTTKIQLNPRSIKTLFGSKKRLQQDLSEDWWNRITVSLHMPRPGAECIDPQRMIFNSSTNGAREDQKELFTSTPIINELIRDISVDKKWSPTVAKTIFELLIPNEFKERLRIKSHVNWVVDKHTAAYPWELLQDSAVDSAPFCIGSGMVRKLMTQVNPLSKVTISTQSALVVADPPLGGFIGQLRGAEAEGKLVLEMLHNHGYKATNMVTKPAKEIITSLFSSEYKIVHLAGHGIFNENCPQKSGMVIGKDLFLSTFEIAQMSAVPELVFVNCCHLGKTDGVAEEYYRDRFKLAANIGTQLIENGVKAVIAAGWEVRDQAALDFTREFYKCMFEGDAFGEAILKARKLVYYNYGESNNTWGAYQCYGDQYYRLELNRSANNQVRKEYLLASQAELDLHNLINELETGKYTNQEALKRLNAISAAVDAADIRNVQIAEKEALIYSELGEYSLALSRYEALVSREKAGFSLATLEKYYKTLSKHNVTNRARSDEMVQIKKAIDGLTSLLNISKTAERYNLLGSAYKRMGLLETDPEKKGNAYLTAAQHYLDSLQIAGTPYLPYPLFNWLMISQLSTTDDMLAHMSTEILADIHACITKIQEVNSDFKKGDLDYWEMVDAVNVSVCSRFVNLPDSKKEWSEIKLRYKDVWEHAGTKGKKLAELEQLEILESIILHYKTPKGQDELAELQNLIAYLRKLLENENS